MLILGGTTEASALATALAARGVAARLSYAGRTAAPRAQPVPVRIGGFGGAEGLATYLRDHRISHIVDATHPFAAQISRNALAASAEAGVPLRALTRPAWQAGPGDRWQRVADLAAAVAALDRAPERVMLALGRMHVDAFAAQPQHHYLLRFVDPPALAPALPHHTLIVDRGPFTAEVDQKLMAAERITLVVCKNAGGSGAVSKLVAARALGLPVIMIDRPALPPREEVETVDAVLAWLGHAADLGV